jgi:hypothetical protein
MVPSIQRLKSRKKKELQRGKLVSLEIATSDLEMTEINDTKLVMKFLCSHHIFVESNDTYIAV